MLIPIKKIQFVDHELNADKLKNLQDSINEVGLLHPVIVQQLKGSDEFLLVTGLYRLKAFTLLGIEGIDATVIEQELDDMSREEIHLHENLKRERLEWPDEVVLVQKLHNLRQTQHGVGKPGRPHHGKQGWGINDTAIELGKSLGSAAQDLQLATYVQNNPSLKNIKDKTTAMRIVKQTAKRMLSEEAQVFSGDVDFADEIFCGEATTILSQLPENSFDFCITDPPWFKFAKVEDPSLTRDTFTLPVFKELYRVMKFDSFLYMFIGTDDWFYYNNELPKLGFRVQGHPCFWAKEGFISRTGVRSWEHGRDFELILLAVKGNPVLTSSTQLSAIFREKVVPPSKLIHPNEKPMDLISSMVKNISSVGALGIDPFAGSGAHLEAFDRCKRHYVGIERDAERFNKIKERLKK